MTYIVSWDGPSAREPDRGFEVEISTLAELDAVLDRVEAHAQARGIPYAVQIDDHTAPGSIMIGVGHPDRSFIDWLLPAGHRNYGYQPDLPEPTQPIAYDVYGEWHEHPPQESRITPATARTAAHQYVDSRERPTCVEWATE